ncbi:hypothetical protein [Phenylobacterium sp.]|uniref:hypothetical protein n=1 Tax=Phenylobacterium sp. TaxID=1871053 RepID=UPI0011F86DE1|nr:hypothetical protein [Phenylobacterium sp.]THD58794.1 MAG: hypothetical protein E8A49_17520 [Phenylobacterium sp.]
MRLTFTLICAAALAAATPTLAAPKAAAGKSCFKPQDIGSHTVGNDHTLYLNVGGKTVWRASMRNICLAGIQSSDPIQISGHGEGGSVCEAGDLDVRATLAGGGGLATHCVVDSVSKLTPAETAALPAGVKP